MPAGDPVPPADWGRTTERERAELLYTFPNKAELEAAIEGGRQAKAEIDARLDLIQSGRVEDYGRLSRRIDSTLEMGAECEADLRAKIEKLEAEIERFAQWVPTPSATPPAERIEKLENAMTRHGEWIQQVQNDTPSKQRVDQLEEHIRRHEERLGSHSTSIEDVYQRSLPRTFWEEWERVRDAVAAMPAPRLAVSNAVTRDEDALELARLLRENAQVFGVPGRTRNLMRKAADKLESPRG